MSNIDFSVLEEQGQVPGLFLLRGYVDDETPYFAFLDAREEEWNTTLKRRTMHFGYEYDYKSRSSLKKAAVIEGVLKDLADDVVSGGLLPSVDQIIVNEYKSGQGISAHTDSAVFGDTIVSVSLGEAATMKFQKGDRVAWVDLEPGDLMLMTGEARREWFHSIGPKKYADRRVSVTMRSLDKR